MKKTGFLFIAATLIPLAASAQSTPTCSLDPTFLASSKVGVWPDSITNFASGTVGQAYAQNITIKVPADTVMGIIQVCLTRFELSSPSGVTNYDLPPGLTLTGTPADLKFPGGQNSCAVISGTPTTAGTYTLQMKVSAFGNLVSPGTNCPPIDASNINTGTAIQTQTVSYYVITVSQPVGIESLGKEGFALYQNAPNPCSDKTTLAFQTPEPGPVQLKVYNQLGSLVYEQNVQSIAGKNTFELDAHNWKAGIYVYSIRYKNTMATKRLVVLAENR